MPHFVTICSRGPPSVSVVIDTPKCAARTSSSPSGKFSEVRLMRYGFAIGGGSGGSAIGAASAVVKSKGDVVEVAVAAGVVGVVVVIV